MMNKYSHALAKLSLRAANMAVEVSETKEVAEYLLTDIYVDRDTLKELIDRADEQMTHILRVRKLGYPTRIAFHSSNEAHDFAVKHDLKGCTLDSIQFAEYEHYDKLLETLKSA